jgi:hypothetical protein
MDLGEFNERRARLNERLSDQARRSRRRVVVLSPARNAIELIDRLLRPGRDGK